MLIDFLNERNLNSVLFKYWLDDQQIKNMFNIAIDKTSNDVTSGKTYLSSGQCIASIDVTSDKTFWSVHYVRHINDDSALLVNLYNGELFSANNCSQFDPDVLNCYTFLGSRYICTCGEFSKTASHYRSRCKMTTNEELEVFEKMNKDVDYELAQRRRL
jgi:hypothetical protein